MKQINIDLTLIEKELNLEKLRLEIIQKFPLKVDFQWGGEDATLWDFEDNYDESELLQGFNELVELHDSSKIVKKPTEIEELKQEISDLQLAIVDLYEMGV